MKSETGSEILCKEKPANASTNCKPAKKPCLFNVEEDPCEFNNLAGKYPEVCAVCSI